MNTNRNMLTPDDAEEIDGTIASLSICPDCGACCHFESHYEKHPDGSYTYRAYVVCDECDYEEEF